MTTSLTMLVTTRKKRVEFLRKISLTTMPVEAMLDVLTNFIKEYSRILI